MNDIKTVDIKKVLEDINDTFQNTLPEKFNNLMRLARAGTRTLLGVVDSSVKIDDEGKPVPCKLFLFIKSEIAKYDQAERISLYGAFIAGYNTAQFESESVLARRKMEQERLEQVCGKEAAAAMRRQARPDDVDLWLRHRARFSKRAVTILGGELRREIFNGNDIQQQYRLASKAFREMPQQFFPVVVARAEDIRPLLPDQPTPEQPVIRFGHIFRYNAAPQQI